MKMIKKLVTGILLFTFIIIGFLDFLLQGEMTYSSIMAKDINRVYFYTFFLMTIGCWLLYNKWFTGIGFILVATFNSYFVEYVIIHNYLASVAIYIGIVIDIIVRHKYKWLIPLIIIGIVQGIAFTAIVAWLGSSAYYIVGCMEFLALCIGSVFVIKKIE
jgi:hypothetical protein